MRLTALFIFVLFFIGCGECVTDTPRGEKTEHVSVDTKDQTKVDKLNKEIDSESDALKKAQKQLELFRLEKDIAQRKVSVSSALILEKTNEIDRIKLDGIRLKIYVASGSLFVISLILIGLGVYFRSSSMIYTGAGTFGLACTCLVAGYLIPYVLYIAVSGAILFLCFLLWMLFGRDKALMQVTKAVSEIKDGVPRYKEIFGKYINESQDKVITETRRRWKDPKLVPKSVRDRLSSGGNHA